MSRAKEVRKFLVARREALTGSINELDNQARAQLCEGAGRKKLFSHPADATVGTVVPAALLPQKKKLLVQVQEALAKSDAELGVCEDCGEDICLARLRCRPEAKRCTSCQEEREDGNRMLQSVPGSARTAGKVLSV